MKKTVIVLSILLVLFLVFPLSMISAGMLTPACYDVTYVGALSRKMERIESLTGPKIIVIGTSSVAFGLRSDILEKETGMPVVNFGLYASLGTKLMLEMAKNYINEGDIVIVSPEQDRQTLSNYFNADMTWRAFDGHFDYLRFLDKQDLSDMAGSYLGFVHEKCANLSSGRSLSVSGVYSADSFNEYGDIEYRRTSNTMFGAFDANTVISFDKDVISDDFIEYLNAFAKDAGKKGARVCFGFCPMNRAALEEGTDSEKIYEYFSYLSEKLDLEIISDPETYIMDSGWFYDSNFHLNDAGAILHTVHLAKDIKLLLGDLTEITTEIPEMPSLPDEKEQEQSEIEFFVTLESDNDIAISGLTEAGKAQKIIEVPSEINGKPVAAIMEYAFSDASLLETVKLSDGLTYIANNAFSGCESLRRVYIGCTDPSAVKVGEDLLAGTNDCVIIAPESLFAEYTSDYNWSQIYDMGQLEFE